MGSEEQSTEIIEEQTSLPVDHLRAVVKGEQFLKLPEDLYIPPDALEVFLEAFEGPLDLLLYLIKRQNLDVLDIPIAEITRQYMEYIDLMKEMKLELAAEYLLMAAMLAEIKSRMLLPRQPDVEDEEDPRAELVRRLQEYERYKKVAESLDELPRKGRDTFEVCVDTPPLNIDRPLPEIDLRELVLAFNDVLQRAALIQNHHVELEPLSVRERMVDILSKVKVGQFMPFTDCFNVAEGRMGVVVSFIAILELLRESMIEVVQASPFAPIHIRVIET